jgi:hypothetical protein
VCFLPYIIAPCQTGFYTWRLHVLFGNYIIFTLETLENFTDFGKLSIYLENSLGNFGENPLKQAQIFSKIFSPRCRFGKLWKTFMRPIWKTRKTENFSFF